MEESGFILDNADNDSYGANRLSEEEPKMESEVIS